MSSTNRGSTYAENGAYLTPLPLARFLVGLLPCLSESRIVLEPSVGGGAFLQALIDREDHDGVYHRFQAIDIDARATGLDVCRSEGGWVCVGDFLTVDPPRPPEVIVGNVPYSVPARPQVCLACEDGTRSSPRSRAGWSAHPTLPSVWVKACERCDGSGIYQPPPEPAAERHIRRALSIVAPGGHVAILLRLAFLETADRFAFWREFPARRVWVLAERPSFTGGGTDSAAYGWFLWEQGYRGRMELEVVSWKGAHVEGRHPGPPDDS